MFSYNPGSRQERQDFYLQTLFKLQNTIQLTVKQLKENQLNLIALDAKRSLWLFFTEEALVSSHQIFFEKYLIDTISQIPYFTYTQGTSLYLQPLYYIFLKDEFLTTKPNPTSEIFTNYTQLIACSITYIKNSQSFKSQEKFVLDYAFNSIFQFVDSEVYNLLLTSQETKTLGSACLAPLIYSAFQSIPETIDQSLQLSLFSIQADAHLHVFVACAAISLAIRLSTSSISSTPKHHIKVQKQPENLLSSLYKGCKLIENYPFHIINYGLMAYTAMLTGQKNKNFIQKNYRFNKSFNQALDLTDLITATYDENSTNENKFPLIFGDKKLYFSLLNHSINLKLNK